MNIYFKKEGKQLLVTRSRDDKHKTELKADGFKYAKLKKQPSEFHSIKLVKGSPKWVITKADAATKKLVEGHK